VDDAGIVALAVGGGETLYGWALEGTAAIVGCASGAGLACAGVLVEAGTAVVDRCVVDAAAAGGCLCEAGVVGADESRGGSALVVRWARGATVVVGLLSESYPNFRGCWST
jgi:hypothetical protein